MRRIFAVVALVLLTVSFAQAKDSADVVVLLDTSESMFPYFEQVVDYIVTKVARDYLRQDDTFHLLTFSDTAQLELAQAIHTEENVRSLISRLYLVYPFGKNTDLITAVNYLQQYANDLPPQSDKMIVIVTDGVHNPSEKSPYSGYSEDQAMAAITETAGKIARNGWKVAIIRIPFDPADASAAKDNGTLSRDRVMKGLEDALKVESVPFDPDSPDSVAQAAMALPILEFPEDLGKRDSVFKFPVKVENTTSETIHLELREVLSSGENIIDGRSFLKLGKGKKGNLDVKISIPDAVPDGKVELPIRLIFADSMRVSPSAGVISFTLRRSAALSFWKAVAPKIVIAVVVLAVLALLILIILMARGMPAKSSATVVGAVKASGQGTAPSAGLTVATDAPSSRGDAPMAAASRASASPEVRDLGFVPQDTNAIRLKEVDDSIKRANRLSFDAAEKASARVRSDYVLPLLEKKNEAQLRLERRAIDERADREGSRSALAILSRLKVKKEGALMLQMSIDRQNPNIGLRNVHSMKAGSRLGIGGGKASPFTIFVVKVPARLAEIYFDGETCHFVPIRRDFFPEIGESMEDCLDRDIAIVTPEGFRMNLRLSRWESPTDRLNRLLHIIDIKGLV